MTLVEQYTFGETDHVALRMLPCLSPRIARPVSVPATLDLLCPNAPVEIRVLTDKMLNRRFRSHVDALAWAEQFSTARAVYVVMNPFDAALIKDKAVNDDAVTRRHWLLIDVDPVRAADTNATDTELEHALTVARNIGDYLTSCGWPNPVTCHSGNGWHLLYAIDLPNDVEALVTVSRVLQHLAATFDTAGAKVDTSVANASRITKLYGTMTRKGPHSPGRPQRPSAIVRVPHPLVAVPRASLQQVADLARATPPRPPSDLSADTRLLMAREWLTHQPSAIEGHGGDDHTYGICCGVLIDHDLTEDQAFAALTDWNARCEPPWEPDGLRAKIRHAGMYCKDVRGSKLRLILNPTDPMPSARKLVQMDHTVDDLVALRHQHGVFYTYEPSAYHDLEEPAMRAELYRFLELAQRWTNEAEPKLIPFQPTKSKVENVLDALRAVCNLPAAMAPPCWLSGRTTHDPLDILACPNGLLYIPTRTLLPPTPDFFTLNGIDFDYTPDTAPPAAWLVFLGMLWPDDPESIATLQEAFGYLLTPDTRQQKILMIVGPKRSGKGLTGRVLRRLVGERNTCSPTLAAFGRDFGKQVLVGKTLAVISDARISGRTDTAMVAETLLSISGEDPQTIERKFLPDWNGKLSVRFLLLTNELFRVGDVSGALASRFIVLAMKESFFGREDHGLFDRFVPELPGILNWALEGRDRLYRRGHFVQPTSGNELMEEFADLSSPEAAFLRECTRTEPGTCVSQKSLFVAWTLWCTDNGRDHPGTMQTFARNVRAVLPGVTVRRLGARGEQERHWEGIRLEMPSTGDRPGFMGM